MIYEIVLIPDEYFSRQGKFWIIGKKKKRPFISISPAQNENYAHYGWWKLKIAAEETGRQVRAYTHINMLPLAYPMADTLFLTTDKSYVRKMYQKNSETGAPVHRVHIENEVFCSGSKPNSPLGEVETRYNPNALKNTMYRTSKNVKVSELIDRFRPRLYVRQSTYDLFQQLDLPEKVIMCELREDPVSHWNGQARRQMRELKFDRPVIGIGQNWQRKMIAKAGSHWLGIQVLGSLLKDWLYVCEGGSANLHTLLPTRCIYLKDQKLRCDGIIRKMAEQRYGKAGKLIPVVGNRFFRSDEIKDNFNIIQEGIRLLEKPEILFKKIDNTMNQNIKMI